MRQVVQLVALIGLFIVTGVIWAADWPQFRGLNADGVSPEKGICKDWNKTPPKLLWKVPMSDKGYAGPSVAAGKVFIIDHKDDKDIVRAIDIGTGRDIWRYEYVDSDKADYGFTRSTPVISDGKVYTLSMLGLLNCLDAKTGKKLWSRNIHRDFSGIMPMHYYSMSPLVDGNKLIVCPGGKEGCLVALDKRTGETIWQGGSSDTPGSATPLRSVIRDKDQYVMFTNSNLTGVDAHSGKLLWSVEWKTDGSNIPEPIVISNSVFATSADGRYRCALVDVSDEGAKVRWENKEIQAHFSSPIYHAGYIYSNSNPDHLVCLDPQTGEVKWKQPGFEKGPLIGIDGVFLVFDGKAGDLVMVNPTPERYEELGRFTPLGGQSWTAPVIANGKLIVRNKTRLACFSLK
ncbi:MAG: PQQ-binding-like beta-propeller repeat protein [Armatimonadetes bacterium]|nr:PQQ-binding-like beta-propeller repeat protein [Armatimonadota bacterium]